MPLIINLPPYINNPNDQEFSKSWKDRVNTVKQDNKKNN